MAEKEKKDAGAGETGRRGAPALVFLALGAILGGVGVVFAVPPQKVEVKIEQPPPQIVPVEHPDLLEFRFNPQTSAGKATGYVSFRFEYEVRDDRLPEAEKFVRAYWNRAKSNCLLLLQARTVRQLTSQQGQQVLTADLVDELEHSLFPGHVEDRVARVTRILWNEIRIQ